MVELYNASSWTTPTLQNVDVVGCVSYDISFLPVMVGFNTLQEQETRTVIFEAGSPNKKPSRFYHKWVAYGGVPPCLLVSYPLYSKFAVNADC